VVSNREEVYSSNDITASAESNEDPVTRGFDSCGGGLPKSGKLECLNAKLAQRDLKGALVKAP